MGFVAQEEEHYSWIILFFATIGILYITKLSISFIKFLYLFFLRPSKNLSKTYGSWAVVIGATDGIGKSIAIELASKGLNLLLVGRNQDKLHQVSTVITNKCPATEIKTMVADLSKDDDVHVGSRLRSFVDGFGLDVGLLVNNAGVTNPSPMYFHEWDVESWMNLVKVNLVSLTEITVSLLPLMLKNGRGAVVNIGSGSTVIIPSYPLFAVYAGTKQYVNQLSRCLHSEYKSRGIDIQCQAPAYVTTNMTSSMLSSKWYSFLLEPRPDRYAPAAVRWIGYEPLCIPYWPHFIQWCVVALVPNYMHYQMRLSANLAMRPDKRN